MKNSLKGRMACVNWQDGIRINKSLYECLSQEPQEPETGIFQITEITFKNKKRFEKAKILKSLVSYAKQFSQNVGHEFNDGSILLTAIRGAAPTESGGRTSASVFGYMRKTNYARTEDIHRLF
jgi:hypothetical protein